MTAEDWTEQLSIPRILGISSVVAAIVALRMNMIYHWLDKIGVLAVGIAAFLFCVLMLAYDYNKEVAE